MSFEFELEKFFPKNNPESMAYEKHKQQFGYDNDYLQVIIENPGGIFQYDFVNRAIDFEHSLRQTEDVESTFSSLSFKHVVNTPTGLVLYPLIHREASDKLESDSIRIFNNAFYKASFSESKPAVSIYLKHQHFSDPERGDLLVENIKQKAAEYQIAHLRLIGKIAASKVFIAHIRDDFSKYLLLGIAISFVLLIVVFRSLKDAIIPFLISFVTIIWTFGMLGWLGFQVNLLSSLIPPILLFISMSDAVHLTNALKQTNGLTTIEKIHGAVKVVWIPTFLTSLTTAVGFLSLLWINTASVQELGIFTSLGILLAFVITYSLGIVLYSFGKQNQSKKRSYSSLRLNVILNHQQKILLLLSALVLVCIPGIFNLRVNAYLLDDLPAASQIRLDFDFTDRHFGGSKPFEIRLSPKDTTNSIWDKEVMDEINKIEEYLTDSYGLVRINAPSTIIKYAHQANNGGLNDFFRYPAKENEYRKALQLKRRVDPKRLRELVTEKGKVGRIVGLIPEIGSYESSLKNRQLLAYLKANIDQNKLVYQLTGTTYLIDKSHEMLSWNLIKGLLTAILIIGIIMALYFRSWQALWISLIPNLIPLLMIAGIIGWFGISLKMTTAIIFTVTFSIAVNDTIHFMTHYLKNSQSDPKKRLADTLKHAGKAILITTLIIIAGFGLFLFSSFGATFYLGLFVCLSLVLAVMMDLTLLPILLINYSKRGSTTYLPKS